MKTINFDNLKNGLMQFLAQVVVVEKAAIPTVPMTSQAILDSIKGWIDLAYDTIKPLLEDAQVGYAATLVAQVEPNDTARSASAKLLDRAQKLIDSLTRWNDLAGNRLTAYGYTPYLNEGQAIATTLASADYGPQGLELWWGKLKLIYGAAHWVDPTTASGGALPKAGVSATDDQILTLLVEIANGVRELLKK